MSNSFVDNVITELTYDLLNEIKLNAYKNKNWENVVDYCNRIIGFVDEGDFDFISKVYYYLMNRVKTNCNKKNEKIIGDILKIDFSYFSDITYKPKYYISETYKIKYYAV